MCPKFELFKKKEIFYLINCDVAFSTPYTAASLENWMM